MPLFAKEGRGEILRSNSRDGQTVEGSMQGCVKAKTSPYASSSTPR